MPQPALVSFVAGSAGPWSIGRIDAVVGATLPAAERLAVGTDPLPPSAAAAWTLRGVTSHARYTERIELDTLRTRQEGLGRPASNRAALIPIRKTEDWWELAQDERRAIFEERSRHIAIGLDYLPAVARRLHHSRELGESFDFLTWFEFRPSDEPAFDRLLERLRATEEWRYVDREVDVRLTMT
jgi:chlorite dismutase